MLQPPSISQHHGYPKEAKSGANCDTMSFGLKFNDRYKEVVGVPEARRKELRDHLTAKEHKSSNKRITAKVEKFESNINNPRRPNKRQREEGVDKTYLSNGDIAYTDTKAATHTEHLRAELTSRGVDASPTIYKGYREIAKKLKTLNRSKKAFKPKTEYFQAFLLENTGDDIT